MPAPIKVELVAYSTEWRRMAADEIERVSPAFGGNLMAIHHVGSTAIPAICAKPILDLMPEIKILDELDASKFALEGLGYESWGEYGIRNRRYCTLSDKTTGRRLVQLHCFRTEDSEIERHLAFRDYLRDNPEVALAYDREKRRCRDLHPDDSHAYTDAKTAWIDSIMHRALERYRRKQ
ncbi:MAG: GrpB family protein [Candidatus Acidiferrales bacterium]